MGTQVILLVALAGVLALVYAIWATGKINAVKVDNERINELSGIIHGGALAFLYREYKALVPFVVIVGALLFWKIGSGTAVCFVLGAFCSAMTGYFGMNFDCLSTPSGCLAKSPLAFGFATVVSISVVLFVCGKALIDYFRDRRVKLNS